MGALTLGDATAWASGFTTPESVVTRSCRSSMVGARRTVRPTRLLCTTHQLTREETPTVIRHQPMAVRRLHQADPVATYTHRVEAVDPLRVQQRRPSLRQPHRMVDWGVVENGYRIWKRVARCRARTSSHQGQTSSHSLKGAQKAQVSANAALCFLCLSLA
jgi:hypothetical protein